MSTTRTSLEEKGPIVFETSPRLESSPVTDHVHDRRATDDLPAESKELGLDFDLPPQGVFLYEPNMREHLARANADKTQPDLDTLGPDAFHSWDSWAYRGWWVPRQPKKDIRVIDISFDGAIFDRGEAKYDEAEALLSHPLPNGGDTKLVCRLIIGVPELGRLDRKFAVKAVNLAGERARGCCDREFRLADFDTRICPGFDLPRLRDVWKMRRVEWKPLRLPVSVARPPEAAPRGSVIPPIETGLEYDRDYRLFLHQSWLTVQTIPLESGSFIFLCGLPSRTFSSSDSAALMTPEQLPEPTNAHASTIPQRKRDVFNLLSQDRERSCRQRFVDILLSKDTATRLIAGGHRDEGQRTPQQLCQLVLLDLLRAVSDHWVGLERNITTTAAAVSNPSTRIGFGGDMQHLKEIEREMTLIRTRNSLFESLSNQILATQRATEHLLKSIALQAKGDEGVNDAGTARWLDRVGFELQSDLEHTRAAFVDRCKLGAQEWSDLGEEARRHEAKDIKRLALVATIFLPLGFGASLLSMQSRVNQLNLLLYDYLGLTIGTGLLVYLVRNLGAWFSLHISTTGFKPFRPRSMLRADLGSAVHLSFDSLVASWEPLLALLGCITVASFGVGMAGDIPRALDVLKYGALSWAGLMVLLVGYSVFHAWGFLRYGVTPLGVEIAL